MYGNYKAFGHVIALPMGTCIPGGGANKQTHRNQCVAAQSAARYEGRESEGERVGRVETEVRGRMRYKKLATASYSSSNQGSLSPHFERLFHTRTPFPLTKL